MLFRDSDGKECEQRASLEAWVDQPEFASFVLMKQQRDAGAASSEDGGPSDDARPPLPSCDEAVSPIQYMAGTSRGKALIGRPGMAKLRLKYNAPKNQLAVVAENEAYYEGAATITYLDDE